MKVPNEFLTRFLCSFFALFMTPDFGFFRFPVANSNGKSKNIIYFEKIQALIGIHVFSSIYYIFNFFKKGKVQ